MSTKGYFSGKTEYQKKGGNAGGKKPYAPRGNGGKSGDGSSASYGNQGYGSYDKPAGKPRYDKSGAKPYGNKPYGDKPRYDKGGDKPYGDKPRYNKDGAKPYGDKPYADKPRYNKDGAKPYGDKTYGDKPRYNKDGAEPYGDKTYGDKPRYDKGGSKPYGEKTYGDKPRYDKGGSKPYGEKTYGDKPRYDKGSSKPYGDKPYADKPRYDKGGSKPYGEKTYGDKPRYGDRPYEDKRKPYERNGKPAYERSDAPNTQQGDADELPFLIIGRNAVREAIKSGRSIDRILVVPEADGSLREILALARDAQLLFRETDRKKLDEICMPFGHGGRTANHQGIVAYAAGAEYCSVKDILTSAKERGEEPFVIVLDGVTDPHNLGSIIRSAECAGAHGVIIGKRRCASVSAAAVKASAGATEHVKIARVTNIGGAIDELKRAGLWIAGADMSGTPMNKQGLNGALALVVGGEGDGMGKLVSEKCDFLVSIPLFGKIGSLNASVAAAILMFEKKRQDAAE